MKTCPKEEILQAYLDDELTVQVSEEIRLHLATCGCCVRILEGMEQALAAMSSAFAVELSQVIPTARLRARIEAALTEQAAPRLAWAQWFWRWEWAAVVLIIAGIASWTLRGNYSIQQSQQAKNEMPAPAATPESSAPLPPVMESTPAIAPQRQHARHRVRHPSHNNPAEPVEAVTEFYPLRDGEDLTAVENLQLVRVELPSSALEEVGLPIAIEAANKPVKADVLLGDDGLARAIRFVR